MDGRCEGAIELVAAIFRLAIADYRGHSYSHDGVGPARKSTPRHRADAREFLGGPWCLYLADQIGLEGSAIWREARRRPGRLPTTREAVHQIRACHSERCECGAETGGATPRSTDRPCSNGYARPKHHRSASTGGSTSVRRRNVGGLSRCNSPHRSDECSRCGAEN